MQDEVFIRGKMEAEIFLNHHQQQQQTNQQKKA